MTSIENSCLAKSGLNTVYLWGTDTQHLIKLFAWRFFKFCLVFGSGDNCNFSKGCSNKLPFTFVSNRIPTSALIQTNKCFEFYKLYNCHGYSVSVNFLIIHSTKSYNQLNTLYLVLIFNVESLLNQYGICFSNYPVWHILDF